VGDQRVVQAGRVVVAARLPLDARDLGVGPVVVESVGDELGDGRRIGPPRSRYVTKPRPPAKVTRRSGPSRATEMALGVSASVRSWSS
jgi:hypothetical protein